MKNILIISQFFSPCNSIAAIRFTKVVKYLARTGKYHFYVLTYRLNEGELIDNILLSDIKSVEQFVTVIHVNKRHSGGNGNVVFQDKKENSQQSLKKRIYNKISRSSSFPAQVMRIPFGLHDVLEEIRFAQDGYRELQKIDGIKMHAMISTYGHVGAHLLGLRYFVKNRTINWIADYRDPVKTNSMPMAMFSRKIVRKTDRYATHITGVSNDCIGSGKYPDKFCCICNSFDPEDLHFIIEKRDYGKFVIGYTGRLYAGKRDMSILFRIIAELIRDGIMEREQVSVVYAGRENALLVEQAERFGVADVVQCMGEISRGEALQLQKSADILCLLTWIEEGAKGIITGKFYEYLLMNKPIFAIVSGKMQNSKTKQMIDELQVGFCVEEAYVNENYDSAKQWIADRFLQYKKGETECLKPAQDKIDQYSSACMAKQFETLL